MMSQDLEQSPYVQIPFLPCLSFRSKKFSGQGSPNFLCLLLQSVLLVLQPRSHCQPQCDEDCSLYFIKHFIIIVIIWGLLRLSLIHFNFCTQHTGPFHPFACGYLVSSSYLLNRPSFSTESGLGILSRGLLRKWEFQLSVLHYIPNFCYTLLLTGLSFIFKVGINEGGCVCG